MQLPVHNLSGEVVAQTEVDDLVFGIEPNLAVMHQALLRQQANARTGTHNTLTRANVSGGGKKPYRQKGTGHARQGSIRSPQYKGGGVVFGPHPRSYKQAMPRKMRRLAVRSALSQKVQEQRLFILSGLAELEPRTKALAATLAAMNAESVLIATQGRSDPVQRAASNLPRVRAIQAENLGVEDMLKYDWVVLDADAIEPMQTVLLDRGRGAGPIEREESAQLETTSFAVAPRASAPGGEAQ